MDPRQRGQHVPELLALAKARGLAQQTSCVSNLRQLFLVTNYYADGENNYFPVGDYPSAVILTDLERSRILDIYREDNERLFATWMPDLPRDAYSSITATKALGSVLSPITVGEG